MHFTAALLLLLAAVVLSLHGSAGFLKAPDPHFPFVHDATIAPPAQYFDYIIVGGGTAGCPLAATLSQNATVLVLERGGSTTPFKDLNITDVVGNFGSTVSEYSSPHSPWQVFVSEDGVYNVRARVLGGGSVINAGFYSHAEAEFVSEVGWEEDLVRRSYEWVEAKVAFEPEVKTWQSAFRDGLVEIGFVPYNGFTYEHVYGTKVGGTIFDREGRRHTAADLLKYANPASIKVYVHATVSRILFTRKGKPRAYGVVFEDALGTIKTAFLNPHPQNEIILTAGALGSPQLLMLSGIGPAPHLTSHGIPVVLDQPDVGQGMADTPMNLLVVPSPVPIENSLIQVVGIPLHLNNYIETASGSSFVDYANASSKGGGVVLEKLKRTRSVGELKLRSTSPKKNPSVRFNYFKEAEDLKDCVEGMRTIIKLIDSRSFARLRYPHLPVQALVDLMLSLPLNLRPRHVSSSVSLEQFCIDTVMTIWHYHGGCQVGKVVDREYRVVGVDGLRVVDTSTFLGSPGTNPQATVMMLGRYMGTRILQERVQALSWQM